MGAYKLSMRPKSSLGRYCSGMRRDMSGGRGGESKDRHLINLKFVNDPCRDVGQKGYQSSSGDACQWSVIGCVDCPACVVIIDRANTYMKYLARPS